MEFTDRIHFSSKRDDWETPDWLFRELDGEFHFNLDVCATPGTAKCQIYYTKAEDALSKNWYGTCWMNPPYGRNVGKWVKKAFEESQRPERGVTVVCLLFARTDTAWFHDYALKGEIRFLRGRVRFLLDGEEVGRPAAPSMIVIFRPPELPKFPCIVDPDARIDDILFDSVERN